MHSMGMGSMSKTKQMTSDPHYHALYKAMYRAMSFLQNEGYAITSANLKNHDFQLIASNIEKLRYIKLMVVPKGVLPSVEAILDHLKTITVPLASSKELWVWEIRTGWHFYPVQGSKGGKNL